MSPLPDDFEALTAHVATALELDAQFVVHLRPDDSETIAAVRKAGRAAARRIGHRVVTHQSRPEQRADGLVVVIVALQGDDLHPDDLRRLQERTRDIFHRRGYPVGQPAPVPLPVDEDEDARQEVVAQMLRDAERVRLDFGLLGFGEDETAPDVRAADLRRATALAGLLWHSSVTLIDQLIDDVAILRNGSDAGGRRENTVEDTVVLADLPERFHHKVTPVIAQQFLVVAVDLTSRINRGWEPLSCVAQELTLRWLLDQAVVAVDTFELHDLVGEHWRALLEETLFEDLDHERLYWEDADGFEDDPVLAATRRMAPMGFDRWFVPFSDGRRLPPYAEDVDAEP